MSGKTPGKGGREETAATDATASPGATTRSREGGVKRGPPIGSASSAKRGPASPSKGVPQDQASSRAQPVTPSKVVSQGLAKCSIEGKVAPSREGKSQGMSTSSGGQKYSIVFGGQFLTPPEEAVCQGTSRSVLSETKCRGCDFDKSSLRLN